MCWDYEKVFKIFKKLWKILEMLNKTNLYKILVKFWRNKNCIRNLKESPEKFKNISECQKIYRKNGKKFQEN